jgi:hypothetical protein
VTPTPATKGWKAAKKSRRRNNDDTDSETEEAVTVADPTKPWLIEWNMYIQTHEAIPEGMGMVRWWGVSIQVFFIFVCLLNLLTD